MAEAKRALVADGVARVASGLVDHRAEAWTTVLDSDTSVVLRGGGFIAKHPRRGDDAFEAEVYGLETAAGCGRGLAPALLAFDRDAHVLVMEDLGVGPSVADALLGDDPDRAETAMRGQATALARLHNATADRPRSSHRAAGWLGERERRARRALRAGGTDIGAAPAAVVESFDLVADRLLGRAGPRALSPGDVCPDNNVMVGGEVHLIDFEGCGDMHPAMDVAYLALPFPTCWCSFDVPPTVKQAAVDAYRAAVTDPVGVEETHLAEAYFATVSVGLMLSEPAPADPPWDEPRPSDRGFVMPSPAQRLIHRLERSAGSDELVQDHPALAGWLGTVLDRCQAWWPDVDPLPVAPAFR